jgi:hypothetical protein
VSDRRMVELRIAPNGVVEGQMHVHREQLDRGLLGGAQRA